MATLISGCKVLDENSKDGYKENCYIEISGKYITGVFDKKPEDKSYEIIDGRNMLAIPGLINAHTHSPENLLRGFSDSEPLEIWLNQMYELPFTYGEEETYLACMMGALEMLRSGTTAVLDHMWFGSGLNPKLIDVAMQAYSDAGIRAVVAPLVSNTDYVMELARKEGFDFRNLPFHRTFESVLSEEEILSIYEDAINKWNEKGDGRVTCIPGPGGIQWSSDKFLEGCIHLSEKYHVGIHIHALETKVQRAACIERYHGKSPIKALAEQGFLRPEMTLAHSIWFSEDDIEAVARKHAVIVHNPAANFKLGSGVAKIYPMLEKGITVALGSDGAASSDNQSMFQIIKLASLIHNKNYNENITWISGKKAFEMATLGGAEALMQKNKLGKIEAGYLADITLLAMDRIESSVLLNAYDYLSFCETGNTVKHVFVNGEQVLKNGAFTKVDEDSIIERIKEVIAKRKKIEVTNSWNQRLVEYKKFLQMHY